MCTRNLNCHLNCGGIEKEHIKEIVIITKSDNQTTFDAEIYIKSENVSEYDDISKQGPHYSYVTEGIQNLTDFVEKYNFAFPLH